MLCFVLILVNSKSAARPTLDREELEMLLGTPRDAESCGEHWDSEPDNPEEAGVVIRPEGGILGIPLRYEGGARQQRLGEHERLVAAQNDPS